MEHKQNLKELPQSLPAEAAVLGSCILDPDRIGTVHELLTVDSFMDEGHRLIWTAIDELWRENPDRRLDGLLVRQWLEDHGHLEGIGGTAYVQQVLDTVPSAANVLHYARIVRQKAIERDLHIRFDRMVETIGSHTLTVEEKLQALEQAAMSIQLAEESGTVVDVGDVAIQVIGAIERGRSGLSTGFTGLDYLITGLEPGDTIILAGRPSMGKTTFGLNLALNVSRQTRVAVFSLETTAEKLTERLLSGLAGVDHNRLIRNRLTQAEWSDVIEAANQLRQRKLCIDDTPGLSPGQLLARLMRLKAERGLGLAIVDYLQLMRLPGRQESREREVAKIMGEVKLAAKRVGIPVVILAQLNRLPDQRSDHRPKLSDLRESGSVEQDADLVMFLYRPAYYEENADKGDAELIVAKNRQGPTGAVRLIWQRQQFTFADRCESYVESE